MPPNIAAEVNAIQQVEFTNARHSVYTKETSPAYGLTLATGSFTNPETQKQFWCSNHGNSLPNCLNSTLFFSDADIVWDRVSNQWFATAVPIVNDAPAGIFFAASTGADATDQSGNWNRWSIDNTTYQSQFPNGLICPTAGYTSLDQPLIGFSQTYVAIDVTCFSPPPSVPGLDTAFVIPISNIKSAPATLGIIPLSNTLPFRSTPSRDRSSSGYEYIWFLSTFLPLAPGSAAPVVRWTTADNSNPPILTSGSTTLGEAAGSDILPNITQPNCPQGYNCTIRGNDSRIRAVDLQVRPTDNTAYLAAAFTYAAASGGYILNWFVQPAANPQAIVLLRRVLQRWHAA